MDKHKDVQLICIGPTIDNHGKFAALKLEKMMRRYPGRVYSKPEFTPIPSFVHSGAEFALMPSRDEPFGLVAVEFGRKGALGVGSRVGGLGSMPGWWFTIESTETKHLLRQFKSAIRSALASSQETRRLMRARSLLQRFPVMQWVHDLEVLQSQSIKAHGSVKRGSTLNLLMPGASGMNTPIPPPPPVATLPNTALPTPTASAPRTAAPSVAPSRAGSRAPSPSRSSSTKFNGRVPSFLTMTTTAGIESEPESGASTPATPSSPQAARFSSGFPRTKSASNMGKLLASRLDALAELDRTQSEVDRDSPDHQRDVSHDGASASSRSADREPRSSGPDRSSFVAMPTRNPSMLSLDTVVGERRDFSLQKVEPFFNDPKGEYYNAFGQLLDSHGGNLSSDKLCVEGYIRQSEKDWFEKFYDAKLGRKRTKSMLGMNTTATPTKQVRDSESVMARASHDEFNLGPDYKPPTGLKKIMLFKIGDWPLYAFLLALVSLVNPTPSSSFRLPANTLAGSNHRRQLVPSHPPHRPKRPVR